MEDGSLSTDLIYREILKEQLRICYLCNGISLQDTDEMSPYDRKFVFETLLEFKKEEIESLQK